MGKVRVPYIVMEYVAGRSLRDLLKVGDLRLKESIQYQVGVLSALEFSHRAGIVHRDIETADDDQPRSVKLVEFQIAGGRCVSPRRLPKPTRSLELPSIFSPEQVRGETADARSDLYSAGCLLYELLTGRPPFIGPDPLSVAYQHVYEEPARASTRNLDLISALDSVLVKASRQSPGGSRAGTRERSQRRSSPRRRASFAKMAVLTWACSKTTCPRHSPWAVTPAWPASTADRHRRSTRRKGSSWAVLRHSRTRGGGAGGGEVVRGPPGGGPRGGQPPAPWRRGERGPGGW